jgi:hypothetical protein
MTVRRKQKSSPQGEQFSLWDGAPPATKEKPVDIDPANVASDNAQKQTKQFSTSQALAKARKRISLLERQLEKEKIRAEENKLYYLRQIAPRLPALLLFEVLKTISLKETREVIKPLKPTAGMLISTTRRIKDLGAIIGLPPSKTDTGLKLLLNSGFVRDRGLGVLDLGEFSKDKNGRVVPSWYRDINDSDHLMLLLSSKDAPPKNI